MSNKIVIIPCSGIGKPYGTIGRDATYIVCDEKSLEDSETDCLGLLVIEDEEIVGKVRSCKVLAVDGCFNECARKSVERVGAEVTEAIHVWKFHQENKLVITGGDRLDLIFASLSAETAGLLLTNNIVPHHKVMVKADELGIPILSVPMDTYTTAKAVHKMIADIVPTDIEKKDLIKEMVGKKLKIAAILR